MKDLRDRIAQVIYGDGDDVLWPRALELADLVAWELAVWKEEQPKFRPEPI